MKDLAKTGLEIGFLSSIHTPEFVTTRHQISELSISQVSITVSRQQKAASRDDPPHLEVPYVLNCHWRSSTVWVLNPIDFCVYGYVSISGWQEASNTEIQRFHFLWSHLLWFDIDQHNGSIFQLERKYWVFTDTKTLAVKKREREEMKPDALKIRFCMESLFWSWSRIPMSSSEADFGLSIWTFWFLKRLDRTRNPGGLVADRRFVCRFL